LSLLDKKEGAGGIVEFLVEKPAIKSIFGKSGDF